MAFEKLTVSMLCLQKEFQRLAHFMKYCQALRERQLPVQTMVLGRLGIKEEDILMQQGFAGMLKPSYVLVRDHKAQCIVLAIRGTHSVKASHSVSGIDSKSDEPSQLLLATHDWVSQPSPSDLPHLATANLSK